MIDPSALVADGLGETLARCYADLYGAAEPAYPGIVRAIAKLVMERLASSDALYHDDRHTLQVTMVGQAILRGRILVAPVPPDDWLHFTTATLVHDIGYLRGICPGDGDGRYVVDAEGGTVEAPRGASDAFLTPWHIERGKLFVRHRLRHVPHLDVERLARAIELTRFPVPQDGDHGETDTEAGLVRAADLIGQLGDPLYPKRLNALFHEFVEIGIARQLGYESPADVAAHYPRFFWSQVEPFIGPALAHLDRTLDGKRWAAQLYAHVFVEEHLLRRSGPERTTPADPGPTREARHA
jgi:hypothetical protein